MGSNEVKKVGPAVAILAILVVPLVIATAGGEDDKGLPDLRVERVLESPALLLTVANELNVPRTARNGKSVVVECLDADDAVVARSTRRWPFLTDRRYDPHVHQRVDPQRVDAVERCRILGATRKLEAEPRGFVPRRLGHTH